MILLLSVAHAACTFRAEPAELALAVDRALASYAALDVPAFEQATTEVDYMVPCLAKPVNADLAAQLHRLRGIGAYTANQPEAAEAALRAARAIAPSWDPPPDLLPEGFALRDLYLAQPTQIAAGEALPKPAKSATLWIDGLQARERPVDAAAIIQVAHDDTLETVYVLPGEPAPTYPGARRRQAGWLVSAAATGIVAGATYSVAAATAATRFDATSAPELRRVQSTTNGLLVGSAGLTAAAIAQVVLASQMGPER